MRLLDNRLDSNMGVSIHTAFLILTYMYAVDPYVDKCHSL